MLVLIKLLSLVILGMGLVYALRPDLMKKSVQFWSEGSHITLAGALRLIFGAVFLFGASQTRVPLLCTLLGAVMVVGGIVIFVLGVEKSRTQLQAIAEKPGLMRAFAAIAIAIGAALFILV